MSHETPRAPHIYAAITAVRAELAKSGISKDRRNEYQKFDFRGIDDMYNAVSGLLAQHGICIMPKYSERVQVERESKKGEPLFWVSLRGAFDFVSAVDGSAHTVVTYGEAFDTADKATNKAMSAAMKYAIMEAFTIPTKGDNDADASHYEPAARHPLTDKQRAEHKVAMNQAANIADLRAVLRTALQAAAAVNDAEAHADFLAHGEAIAKELAKAPEKAAA